MGALIFSTQLSLDGRTSGPAGELDWHRVGPEALAYFNEQARAADTFLYGRRTFELMIAFWPTADERPDSSPEMVEYARLARRP